MSKVKQKQNLVLLPGLLSDATVWHAQTQALANQADIIIPDLSQADTPEAMVDTIMNTAPEQFALAGHSMGGWLALELMRHHAHRVTKLCLLNTSAKPDSAEKRATRLEMVSLAEQGHYSEVIARLLNVFVYRQEFNEPIRKMLEKNKHAFVNQEKAMLVRDDCVPLLSTITCPTLLIFSYNDAVFDMRDAEILVEGIEQSRLSIINDCGHMSLVEASGEVSELMRLWLKLS